MVLFLLSKTEYLLENMEARVKDSAVLSRQEPEKLQQKVKCTLNPKYTGKQSIVLKI